MKLPESTATIRSGWQHVVERDRERPRVDPAAVALVGVGDVAPAILGLDPLPEVIAPVPGYHLVAPGHRDLTGDGGDVAEDAEVDGPVPAERAGLVVHLHDDGARRDQRAVPHRPHVQRAAPADDEVRAPDQLGRQRRGEAAADV